jgi:hypothetical protein
MNSKGAGSNVDSLDCTPGVELPPDVRRAAALKVCHDAVDAEDARLLLEMLGLLDVPKVARRWERR